jgi:hypothetical protein
MKYISTFFCLLLIQTSNHEQEYPWKDITFISIHIQLNSTGFGIPPDSCSCNCKNNSSVNCQYNTFSLTAWDNDKCFWINFFNSSKPEYKSTGASGISSCGITPRIVNIEITTTKGEKLTVDIYGNNPKGLRMNINEEKCKWDFHLDEVQLNILNQKIDDLVNCGIKDLQSRDKRAGCD